MNKKVWRVAAGLCVLAMSAVWASPADAQMSEGKEKQPMYSYVSFWNIPRAQWADMAKEDAANQKLLDKAVANGTLVGYGEDVNLVHQPDGATHDEWWSATSMAGVLNVLDQFYKTGTATSPVLASATKHWDSIYVSRFYNWHPGSWKDAYTYVASYKLKPDAPDDAVETRYQFVSGRAVLAYDLALRQPLPHAFSLNAGIGYRDLRWAVDSGYVYGNAGLGWDWRRLHLDLSYIGTNGTARRLFYDDMAVRRLVGSVQWHF